MTNLPTAPAKLIGGATGSSEPIAAYNAALEIFTPTALPINCLTTAGNLGDLLFEIERWQQAINAYDKAIQAVELSRSWATDNTRRQEILEDAINVYKNIVQACINNEQPEKAIEYAQRSKARNLVELVYNSQLEPKGNIPQKQQVIDEFKLLRRQIEDEQRFLNRQTKEQNSNIDNTPDDIQSLSNVICEWLKEHPDVDNALKELEKKPKRKEIFKRNFFYRFAVIPKNGEIPDYETDKKSLKNAIHQKKDNTPNDNKNNEKDED